MRNIRQQIITSIHNREMQAAIQPIVDVRDMHWHGVEALARLNNTTARQLIQTADSHDLGHIVSLQVLEVTLMTVNDKAIPINFNLSPQQLLNDEVVGGIQSLLEQHDYPAKLLTIELTESPSSHSTKNMLSALSPLLNSGARLSLDDFGVDSQNLQRVLELPLKQLKIDRSFIRDIHLSGMKQDIVLAIIELTSKYQIEAICEGVEKREESDFLLRHNAHLHQGYLHCKPKLLPYKLNELSDLHSTFNLEAIWGGDSLANNKSSCNI
ncbi:EAL domain-containing protein [Vibrio sp. TRT 29B02]|uniref:EAL domain-containing protein n=1 Tax=Vibrio sp. TRT 29B02 TaxID=3418508 RepID=UPI003CE7808A